MISPTVNRFHWYRLLCSGIISSVFLCACDASQHSQTTQQDQSPQSSEQNKQPLQDISKTIVKNQQDQGRSLTEIAGQATFPSENRQEYQQENKLVEKALSYVGRYHTRMSCSDAFAACNEGSTEFIVNLLPDGSAHRSFVYLGKVTYDNRGVSSDLINSKNTWSYDEEKHEIVVRRQSGFTIYYQIDEKNNLVMDLNRIIKTNKKYVSEYDVMPTQAYVLKKYSDS